MRAVKGRAAIATVALASIASLGGLLPAHAAVDPPSFEATLTSGESTVVTKTVEVPEVPRRLDLFLIVDLTGSYVDDLPRMKALAPQIFDHVRSTAATSAFGLGTHVDFPFGSWGGAGEYGYRLDQPLTLDRTVWVNAINGMRSLWGNDGPESQYEALYQAVTGAGRQMPTTNDGDFTDPGEIAPGQSAGFRPNATRVIAITTDSAFHMAGDAGGPFPYPGPSRDEVINALKAANVRVVSIKAPGATTQMDDVANQTGGAIVFTSNTSAEIGNAILRGLGGLNFDVTASEFRSCAPLEVEFTPPSHTNVPGGTTVTFEERISVPTGLTPADLPPDGVVTCTVRFLAGESGIAVQQVRIKVILNRPPDCSTVRPDVSTLLPPNHFFRRITLSGATDPDGDPVTLTIGRVTQDEPVNDPGSGSTSPDARRGPDPNVVSLRAERSGTGDGRVYTIHFEGSDGRGGTCSGSVQVSVPHSRNSAPAVDSGQAYDSFGL